MRAMYESQWCFSVRGNPDPLQATAAIDHGREDVSFQISEDQMGV